MVNTAREISGHGTLRQCGGSEVRLILRLGLSELLNQTTLATYWF